MKNQDFNKQTDTSLNKPVQKSGVSDKVGGAIEKLGHKISDMGAKDLGQKIHDIGDSLETDHKNPAHPHDV